MWIMFDFKLDYVGKPVWNPRNCVHIARVCVHVFKLWRQLCLDGIFTMTFNAEACGLHGWHAGKRLSLWTCCSARILWPNLSKRPERVWPSRITLNLNLVAVFFVSIFSTLLSKPLYSQQSCCVPVSEVLKCCSEIWPVSIKSQCFIKIDLV